MDAVRIPTPDAVLDADVDIPQGPVSVVAFAHGSGSGRHSPRNRQVAHSLAEAGIATVLADLLTPEEEAVDVHTRQHRFDIGLLGRRTTAIVDWLTDHAGLGPLPVGLFGASTGAAAAVIAAAARPDRVGAVVSRGGRPDLADGALAELRAPTLLIVGGRDDVVIELNEQAQSRITGAESELKVVPGATHLFEEPGALEQVAALARAWFHHHLGVAARR